ncbi:MAG TPA: hypothetical protein VMF52_20020 [Steroidobacteraceae bacterium]|nr:hypothetical protein [Steroidobacteraceae bacterium]
MSHIKPLIAELQTRLADEEKAAAAAIATVNKTKTAINVLCDLAGEPPMFTDIGDAPSVSTTPAAPAAPAIRPDQYYNKPLATCVKAVLAERKAQGPMSVADIYAVLKAGGYNFETKDPENAQRGLAVSISKNTPLFARLPNGLIGLTEWYGGPKRKGKKDADASDQNGDTNGAADATDDGEDLAGTTETPPKAKTVEDLL